MLKEIFIPKEILYETALKFSLELSAINIPGNINEIIIDASFFSRNNGRIEPYGCLLLINSLNHFIEKSKFHAIPVSIKYVEESLIKNTYAKSMRLYRCLGIPIGKSPKEDYLNFGRSNHLPIIEIDINSLNKSLDEYRDIKFIVDHVAEIVSMGNEELKKYIDYCLTEIIRNISEHSGVNEFWCAAQFWPSLNGGSVEFAIMDRGIGVQKSLPKELEDEEKKLQFAILPGCSGKPTIHYSGDNAPNAGFGLYMISEIGNSNGDFILSSNSESLVRVNDSIEIKDAGIEGTAIRLRLNINEVKDYKIERDFLIDEGMKKVKEYLSYIEIKKFAPGRKLPVLF